VNTKQLLTVCEHLESVIRSLNCIEETILHQEGTRPFPKKDITRLEKIGRIKMDAHYIRTSVHAEARSNYIGEEINMEGDTLAPPTEEEWASTKRHTIQTMDMDGTTHDIEPT